MATITFYHDAGLTRQITAMLAFILFEARKPGEFSATSKASSENEKRTFTRSGNVYGHFRSGIHVAYCIVMQNAI